MEWRRLAEEVAAYEELSWKVVLVSLAAASVAALFALYGAVSGWLALAVAAGMAVLSTISLRQMSEAGSYWMSAAASAGDPHAAWALHAARGNITVARVAEVSALVMLVLFAPAPLGYWGELPAAAWLAVAAAMLTAALEGASAFLLRKSADMLLAPLGVKLPATHEAVSAAETALAAALALKAILQLLV